MGKPKPSWKGQFVNREWLRHTLEQGFNRIAQGDFDEEMGKLINQIEIYVAGQALKSSREAMEMIQENVEGAIESLAEFEKAVGRDQLKRMGGIFGDAEDEEEND